MRITFVVSILAAALVAACTGSNPTAPSPTAGGGVLFNTTDLPPTTVNSCPGDAPTLFEVDVDGPTGTLYKFTFDWRRTGSNPNYLLEVKRRERNNGPMLPAFLMTLTPGDKVRYLIPGIYHFRLRSACDGSLWSTEVVKNAGVHNGEAELPPPPPPPPPVEPPAVCLTNCD